MEGLALPGEAVDEGARAQEISLLFERNYKTMCRIAYVILGDPRQAEDAAMDAFVKAVSGWNRYRRLKDPDGYFRKSVVNICRSAIRRRVLEARTRMTDRDDTGWNPERSTEIADLMRQIRLLPVRQRVCIALRYLEDLPEKEIAELMDISVGTVKSQLSKARAKLAILVREDL